MPVSSLTCTRTGFPAAARPARKPSRQATTSASAASATGRSVSDRAPRTSSVPPMPAARSALASSAVATPSHSAPPACAARAAATAPWP
jgi:hypothetical protein